MNHIPQKVGDVLVLHFVRPLFLRALCGCSSHDAIQLAPVRDTVTYQGKRLDHGSVVFSPKKGATGVQSIGVIDGSGFFEIPIASRAGASPGKRAERQIRFSKGAG